MYYTNSTSSSITSPACTSSVIGVGIQTSEPPNSEAGDDSTRFSDRFPQISTQQCASYSYRIYDKSADDNRAVAGAMIGQRANHKRGEHRIFQEKPVAARAPQFQVTKRDMSIGVGLEEVRRCSIDSFFAEE